MNLKTCLGCTMIVISRNKKYRSRSGETFVFRGNTKDNHGNVLYEIEVFVGDKSPSRKRSMSFVEWKKFAESSQQIE